MSVVRQPRKFIADPASIVSPALRIAWFKSDTSVTSVTSRVSNWGNIWSGGDLAQATAGNKPLLVSATFNGFDGIKADDTSRFMDATLSPGVSVGSLAYVWMFARTDSNAAAKRHLTLINSGASSACLIRSNSNGTKWAITATSTGASNAADSTVSLSTTPALVEVGLVLGGSGYGVVSGVAQSGTAPGAVSTNALTSLSLFSNGAGSTTFVPLATVFEIVVMAGVPDHARKIAMREYFRKRYGAI